MARHELETKTDRELVELVEGLRKRAAELSAERVEVAKAENEVNGVLAERITGIKAGDVITDRRGRVCKITEVRSIGSYTGLKGVVQKKDGEWGKLEQFIPLPREKEDAAWQEMEKLKEEVKSGG